MVAPPSCFVGDSADNLRPVRRTEVAAYGGLVHLGAMDEETSRRVCSLIAGVICSDEKMSPDERSFLLRVVEQFGLARDIALMPTTDRRDVVEELAKLPESIRHETLDLLIAAAAADGKIVQAERDFLNVVTAQLGVSDADLEQRLAQALSAS